jgi:hypothetical protein
MMCVAVYEGGKTEAQDERITEILQRRNVA